MTLTGRELLAHLQEILATNPNHPGLDKPVRIGVEGEYAQAETVGFHDEGGDVNLAARIVIEADCG